MELWQAYYTPQTVDEALDVLRSHAGEAKVIGGGTDLMIDLQYSTNAAALPLAAMVDVTRVAEMTRIEASGDTIIVGAAATHTQIVKSAMLEASATCLVESCGVVGGPQVRNVGTLGGNVAHALPAGDGTTSLMALDAEADVAWSDGRREWLPLRQLFRGPGQSALDTHRDLLVAFRFRARQVREGSAFSRIMRPQGVALPVLACAVWVRLSDDLAAYEDVRVCVGPVGPVPTLATSVEDALRGQPVGDAALDLAVETAYRTLEPRASKYRATAEYRSYMVETLLRRALPRAAERARTGVAHAEGVGLG
jgi:CO/xanthine dehydrogenase FAD-binding subunit